MLSPGINTKEGNIGSTVTRATNGTAALVGKFNWGPAYQIIQVTGDSDLIDRFGTPDNNTANYVMSGVNFLKYGNDLRCVRVLDVEKAKNASPLKDSIAYTIASAGSAYAVGDTFEINFGNDAIDEGVITEVNSSGAIQTMFIPSGKILDKVKELNLQDLSNFTIALSAGTNPGSGVSGSITPLELNTDSKMFVANRDTARDSLTETSFQTELVKYKLPALVAAYAGEYGDNIEVEVVSFDQFKKRGNIVKYPYGNLVPQTAHTVMQFAPQTKDQYALVVRVAGVIKESFVVSTNPEDRDMYNSKIYIDDFFANGTSRYISAVAMNWPVGFSGVLSLKGGLSANESASTTPAMFMTGWDYFADRETIQIGSLIAGAIAGEDEDVVSTVQKYVCTIASNRADCVVFVEPPMAIMINKPVDVAVDNIEKWRTGFDASGEIVENNMNVDNSYAFIVGNCKYQYDKYNDVNRWVPISADIAGLCARTDTTSYSWMSPAGYNRGGLLDCIKIAVDTKQSHRDRLYPVQINEVIATSGEGFILFGDKTATSTPTPFNRINVRRLSNMLKIDISNASKYKLFENNDAFTRSDFRLSTTQYLDNIRTLGGVYDFRVICDETNNTAQVIDENKFIGTMYYKPARSINFIELNFVATSTGTSFDEIIGPR